MRPLIETVCPTCRRPFRTRRPSKLFCSRRCKQIAYRKRRSCGHGGNGDISPQSGWKLRPKTYAEIVFENRHRKNQAGWRGQPVIGGGHTIKDFNPLRVAEY